MDNIIKTSGLSLSEYCKTKEGMLFCAICAGIVLLVIGIGIVLGVLFGKRSKKKKALRVSMSYEDRTVSLNVGLSNIERDNVKVHRIKLTNRADSMKICQCDFKGTVLIGRNPNLSTLLISGDNSISGRHCGIYAGKEDFFIRNLNSSNGTKVNGIPLSGEFMLLYSGDIIKLGRSEYIVELE